MRNLLLLLIVFGMTSVAPQAVLIEGHIKFKIKMTSEDEENKMAVAMANGTTLEIYFKGDKTRTEMKMGPIFNVTTITNLKTDKMLTLTSGMMGKKAMVGTISEMKVKADESSSDDDFEIKVTDETKKIQGYLCRKAIIIAEDSPESVFWFTKEIDVSKGGHAYLDDRIPGFPMEFEMNSGGMVVKMVATSVERTLGKSPEKLFDMTIPKGY